MITFDSTRNSLVVLLLALFTGCNAFFETETDRDAQIALESLIRVQEDYRRDHQRYAKTIFEIEKENKYDLKYHKGLIYMEIEAGDESGYRAISLPAESTTARVFAYDSSKGGFYEMEDEETSQYVLGAFRSIQSEKETKWINDISTIILILAIAFLGIYSMAKKRELDYGSTYAIHFLSLGPLFFALVSLNRMNDQIVFSPLLYGGIYLSLVLSVFCIVVGGMQIRKYYLHRGATSLVGLLTSIILSSLFSVGTLTQALLTY